MMNAHDARHFEAAIIRDGMEVDVILRRRCLPVLDHLTPAARRAVETYAAVYEAVQAGGVSVPRDGLSPKVSGGSGAAGGASREGRQSRAVDQAAFLRRMDEALRCCPDLAFGRRAPVVVSAIDFWFTFAVLEFPLARALKSIGVKRGPIANGAAIAALEGLAARVLDAMAAARDPMAG